LDLVSRPELAALPEHGFRIAGLYWQLNGCNELADKLTLKGNAAETEVFTRITRRINGGTNGLTDRLNYFRVAKQVLHTDEPEQASDENVTEIITDSHESVAQAESPAEVSPDTDVDLLGAAVKSPKAKAAGMKLLPRVTKQLTAAGTFLWALYEANKMASIVVLLVVAAGAAWLGYHNRNWLRARKTTVKAWAMKALNQ
jgi:hypothetical protein